MSEAAETVVERTAPTVLTNENADAFYDEKLGVMQPEPEKVETPKTDDADEAIKQAGKKNPKIESRFSELSEKRKAAEKDAEEARSEAQKLREEREALQLERDALKAKYEPPKTDPLGPEPQPEQFADAKEYGSALKEWTTEKTERDHAQKDANEKQAKAWTEKAGNARKDFADYDEKVNASTVKVSDAVRDAIIESDIGAHLQYYLADNPKEATRLAGLSERSALRELGKIEAKLADKVKGEPKNELAEIKPEVEVSKAPVPPTPLRGTSGGDIPRQDGNGKYHGTYAQYKADREAGRIK